VGTVPVGGRFFLESVEIPGGDESPDSREGVAAIARSGIHVFDAFQSGLTYRYSEEGVGGRRRVGHANLEEGRVAPFAGGTNDPGKAAAIEFREENPCEHTEQHDHETRTVGEGVGGVSWFEESHVCVCGDMQTRRNERPNEGRLNTTIHLTPKRIFFWRVHLACVCVCVCVCVEGDLGLRRGRLGVVTRGGTCV
jgi:hypothetical protein